jgi:hypothetical protein
MTRRRGTALDDRDAHPAIFRDLPEVRIVRLAGADESRLFTPRAASSMIWRRRSIEIRDDRFLFPPWLPGLR